jgi:hypothetical protein
MRIVIARATMLLCGLLVATALVPAIASAGSARCDPGEFCLYYWFHRSGGLYNFSGSDRNLSNDHFEGNHTNRIVANLTLSVWNRGVADPGGKNDVIVYDTVRGAGGRGCIRRGEWGDLPIDWENDIEGYEWVGRARCNAVPHMALRHNEPPLGPRPH